MLKNKTITYINTQLKSNFKSGKTQNWDYCIDKQKSVWKEVSWRRRTELQLFLLRLQKQQNGKTENTGQTASMSLLTFVAQAAENLEATTTATPTTKAKNLQKTRQNAGNYNKQGKPAGSSKRNLL